MATAAVDTAINVTRDDSSGIITAAVELQRDADIAKAISFRLHPVVIGTDSDGDQISSCVVVQCDSEPSSPLAKMSPDLRCCWDALVWLWDSAQNTQLESEKPAPGQSQSVVFVRVEDWKDEYRKRRTDGRPIKPDSLERAFRRHVETLKKRAIVGVYDGKARIDWSKL